MRISLIAVGSMKEPHYRAAAEEYLKRLRSYADVRVIEVADKDLSRDEKRAVAEEGAAILKALPDGAYVVALEAGGAEMASEAFSAWLRRRMNEGHSSIAFVIGGAAGMAPDVRSAARETLSLSRMTFPHQLARVVLLEQVYRGFRILRGEPYHR